MTFAGHDRTLAVGPSNANKCGGELFPWRLIVDAGQRVNVTLIQFATNDEDRSHDDDAGALSASSNDDQYDVEETDSNGDADAPAVQRRS